MLREDIKIIVYSECHNHLLVVAEEKRLNLEQMTELLSHCTVFLKVILACSHHLLPWQPILYHFWALFHQCFL